MHPKAQTIPASIVGRGSGGSGQGGGIARSLAGRSLQGGLGRGELGLRGPQIGLTLLERGAQGIAVGARDAFGLLHRNALHCGSLLAELQTLGKGGKLAFRGDGATIDEESAGGDETGIEIDDRLVAELHEEFEPAGQFG